MRTDYKTWYRNFDGIEVTVTRDLELKYEYSPYCSDEELFFLAILFSASYDYYNQFCESDLPTCLDSDAFPESQSIRGYDQLIAFLATHDLSLEQILNLFRLDREDFKRVLGE